MRKLFVSTNIILSIAFVFTLLMALFAQKADIKLDNKEAFGSKQRSAVDFPHETHMESDFECLDCHHDYEDGKNVLDEDSLEEGSDEVQCANCHDQDNKYNLMEAFHLQCMGCHGKLKKEGKSTGPRLCGECHPKKQANKK